MQDNAKTIADFLRKLADLVENTPDIAERFQIKVDLDKKSAKKPSSVKKPITPPPFNARSVFQLGGEPTLRERLEACSIEELKAIIKSENLDRNGITRRWTKLERIRGHILEQVSVLAKRGEVFE